MTRLLLALRMTLAYRGRFPRRRVFSFYWIEAGELVRQRRQRASGRNSGAAR